MEFSLALSRHRRGTMPRRVDWQRLRKGLILARAIAGLSETDLAKAEGLSKANIYKVEHKGGEQKPELETIEAWMVACGGTLAGLWDYLDGTAELPVKKREDVTSQLTTFGIESPLPSETPVTEDVTTIDDRRGNHGRAARVPAPISIEQFAQLLIDTGATILGRAAAKADRAG